jgi:hypothetical protein
MEDYKPSIQQQLYFYKTTCGSQSAVKVDHDKAYSAYRFEVSKIATAYGTVYTSISYN